MTTPNIKALAEKIKRIGDREKTRFIQWRPNNQYLLASALLRVLEVEDGMYKALERTKNHMIALSVTDDTHPTLQSDKTLVLIALESHNKLMEELVNESHNS